MEFGCSFFQKNTGSFSKILKICFYTGNLPLIADSLESAY